MHPLGIKGEDWGEGPDGWCSLVLGRASVEGRVVPAFVGLTNAGVMRVVAGRGLSRRVWLDEVYGGAGGFEFLFGFVGGFFADLLEDDDGGGLDEVFGFFESEGGDFANGFDDVDLLGSDVGDFDVEFGLFFFDGGFGDGDARGHCDGCGRGADAELFFDGLYDVGEVENGHRFDFVDELFFGEGHFVSPGPFGLFCALTLALSRRAGEGKWGLGCLWLLGCGPLWVDVPSAEAPAFAGMTAFCKVLSGRGDWGFGSLLVGFGLCPHPGPLPPSGRGDLVAGLDPRPGSLTLSGRGELVAGLCPLWVPAFAGMTAVDTVLRGIGDWALLVGFGLGGLGFGGLSLLCDLFEHAGEVLDGCVEDACEGH